MRINTACKYVSCCAGAIASCARVCSMAAIASSGSLVAFCFTLVSLSSSVMLRSWIIASRQVAKSPVC
ncbi:Uncharacterised protein [Vibrio cholerae]|nr:Uncharacterised protein [Vibrio cholerae]CSD51519.1 Uncharacterised protein [Vibrio cholerae]